MSNKYLAPICSCSRNRIIGKALACLLEVVSGLWARSRCGEKTEQNKGTGSAWNHLPSGDI